jgi:outer membrane protein assembly factor BamB
MYFEENTDSESKRKEGRKARVSRRDWLTTVLASGVGGCMGVGTVPERPQGAGPSDQKWSFKIDASVSSSPTVADGTVYVGSYFFGNLYAIDVGTGEEEWAFRTGDLVSSSPTVADGTVYVGSEDNNLYAVDAESGDQEWVFETGDWVDSSPTVADGTVYVGSYDENLYAVDTATGEQEWAFETGGGVDSSPTVADGTVYVGSYDENLYAVDTATGEQEWAFETGAGVYSSPTVADGTVYVGSYNFSLYAVDAGSGDQEWVFETGDRVYSSPTVADGTVYVGSDNVFSHDENLYAVDAATGDQEWTFETGDRVYSSPTVADGTVYVGSNNDNLYAVDAESGDQQWTFETGGLVRSSPTVADGTVYVGSNGGNLYAVGTDHTKSSSGSRARLETLGHHVQSPQSLTARFSVAPTQPETGTTVVFNASNSSAETEITQYQWDFTGDGTVDATGQQPTHTYTTGGSYTVRLTVTDRDGLTATTTETLTVSQANQPPTATFRITPTHPVVGTTVRFDASGASDDSGIVGYEWDFDADGTVDATGRQATHSYESLGVYTVRLTVTDADGATDTTTRSITVSEPEKSDQSSETSGGETFTYKPSSPTVDTTVRFDANEFPSDATATSYEWDFTGDGTADAFGSTVRHIFSSGGTQTVTLTADLESEGTETVRRSVLVNTPPEPGFRISPSPAIIEEPTTFDASETTDSTGSIESYEWDFDGDGTTDKTGRAVTQTFAEEGRPTVTLRVTDTQGVTATESRSIRVQRAATFSVQLRDTTITPDGETTAAITVNNLLGSDRLLTQLELDLPSGWDVTFVDAGSASGGTATEIFETQAGQTRTIRARITPNDTGEFSVSGRVFYYIGDQNPPRHTRQLSSGTLTVTNGKTTSESTASPTETSTTMPGLGVGTGATALGAGLGALRALDLLDDDGPDQSERE